MKIIWNKNPIFTRIELDEHEKEILKYKIIEQQYKSIASVIRSSLKADDTPRAISYANMTEPDVFNKRINQLYECYLDDLKHGHWGSCVTNPCSCSKCDAERMLGINTIENISKFALIEIHEVYYDKPIEFSINDMIHHLENLDEDHRDSYTDEAAKWLKQYRDEHFPDEK